MGKYSHIYSQSNVDNLKNKLELFYSRVSIKLIYIYVPACWFTEQTFYESVYYAATIAISNVGFTFNSIYQHWS